MPTIYSNTSDGHQCSGLISNDWDTTHDAVGYRNPSTTLPTSTAAAAAYWVSARSKYYICRGFFDFDTSGITSTVTSATLTLRIRVNDGASVIALKSGHDPSTTTDDWFSTWLTDQSITLSGWGSGDVTAYSADTAPFGGVVTITLNATALVDLVSLSSFKIAVLDHDYDYSDTTAGVDQTHITGFYFADASGTSSDPKIDYTSFGKDINGVSNIGKINGIATANISKVNGV